MKKIHKFLTQKGIYDRARSCVSILFILGLCFISFEIGSLVEKSNLSPSSDQAVQLKDSEDGVKGAQVTQLMIEPDPGSTNSINYIYLTDYSYLINNLKREKQYIETYRGSPWYESEKTKIEEDHNNRSQSLFKYYIDIINHYEFLISQCGDCNEAEYLTQKTQEAAAEYETAKQQEETRYQQELNSIESTRSSFETRLQTVQKLIDYLESGKEPDSNFWDFYDQSP